MVLGLEPGFPCDQLVYLSVSGVGGNPAGLTESLGGEEEMTIIPESHSPDFWALYQKIPSLCTAGPHTWVPLWLFLLLP